MELIFYKQPFNIYYSRVSDKQHNFCFQFEPKFTPKGNYADGWLEMQEEIMLSLNCSKHRPLPQLNLSFTEGNIYNFGEHIITIRGWGNLTGIGANNFSAEKAAKIQDDFGYWIIYKLTKLEDGNTN